MSLIINEACKIIKTFESFKDNVYLCPAGLKTFGYGSLLRDFPDMHFPITEEQASLFLIERVKSDFRYLQGKIKVALNSNQQIALLDFVYNVGRGALQRSTLLMKVNRSEFDLAAEEFLRWNKATINGIPTVLKGLTRRRLLERHIFLSIR